MTFPYLGHGVGLRVPHYERALAGALEVDWVEVVTENFFGGGGRPRAVLEAVRRDRPLVFHGVSLGIGSLDPPEAGYLRRLRALASDFEPAWISDHACWTRLEGRESHELLPLPFTEEALAVAVENTRRVQDALGRPLVLENASSYVRYAASQLSEWEFLAELSRRSGCSLLLDLNNVVVSAYNHGFSPDEYLAGVPSGRVVQLHLANHSQYPHHKFDDHRGPVPEEVWSLYEAALRRFGLVSSLIEWDEDLPGWERLVAERDEAERRARRVLPEMHPTPDGGAPPVVPAPQRASFAARASQRSEAAGSITALARTTAGEEPLPGLAASQRILFAALAWPRGVGDLAASDAAARCELDRTFAAAPEHAPFERLELYANAYFYRQLDALRDVFPRVARLVGEPAFHDLITDYVLERPSNDPDLHRRGERLPAFLREHPLGRQGRVLVELAELELALARALDAVDALPLARTDLARLTPSHWLELELALVPSAQVVRASCDLELVARLCDAGDTERALAAERTQTRRDEAALDAPVAPAQVALSAASAGALVFRRGHRAHFRMLGPAEALALDGLSKGTRFDALCERLAACGTEPATIVAWLERWTEEGLLRRPHPER